MTDTPETNNVTPIGQTKQTPYDALYNDESVQKFLGEVTRIRGDGGAVAVDTSVLLLAKHLAHIASVVVELSKQLEQTFDLTVVQSERIDYLRTVLKLNKEPTKETNDGVKQT